MAAQLRHPAIRACAIALTMGLLSEAALAQPSEPERERLRAPLAIDRAAFAIDVAAQRRALDSSIRQTLSEQASAKSAEIRVATSGERGQGLRR